MNRKKILSVVGARPQFVKLAPISNVLKTDYDHTIVHTGQHYDDKMSNLFFVDLEIPKPKYNLGIGSLMHGEQTGKMITEIEKILITESPFLVIVYGDTNSTLAASIAAAKLNIKIIHVESGLRSNNRIMPEEINRILTDHSSDFLFAPTKTAMFNLKKEGLSERSFLTGDIMVDSIKENLSQAIKKSDVLSKINSSDYYLLTLHRPYNVDNTNSLNSILKELDKIGKEIIFPVHPRTEKMIMEKSSKRYRNIRFFSPFGYFDFLVLQKHADKIVTDSGGIQKEAYILRKPCITLRSETEWIETIESGWNILIDPNTERSFAEKIKSFVPPNQQKNIFGNMVAIKMLKIINAIPH
jgi:UDP-N-acetylglucosamine 2-epimerase